MRELIDEIFARHLSNPDLDVQADAVPLTLNDSDIMFTTDVFTVQPLDFPGRTIGSLAVHGTKAYADAIDVTMDLTAYAAEQVRQADHLTLTIRWRANRIAVVCRAIRSPAQGVSSGR